MIRRRHFTPAMRRRLAELDDKPGLGDEVIQAQATVAEARLRVVDETSPAWRALLNDYPHAAVAKLAGRIGNDPERVRGILEAQFGRPLL